MAHWPERGALVQDCRFCGRNDLPARSVPHFGALSSRHCARAYLHACVLRALPRCTCAAVHPGTPRGGDRGCDRGPFTRWTNQNNLGPLWPNPATACAAPASTVASASGAAAAARHLPRERPMTLSRLKRDQDSSHSESSSGSTGSAGSCSSHTRQPRRRHRSYNFGQGSPLHHRRMGAVSDTSPSRPKIRLAANPFPSMVTNTRLMASE